MRTSYADSTLYPFTKVFRAPHLCDDVFQPLLPVVLDCINGVNGAIVVCKACLVLLCMGLFAFAVWQNLIPTASTHSVCTAVLLST